MLAFDIALDLFPVHTKWRVGKHVIELVRVELVVAKGVAKLDAAYVLTFDEHIAFADGIALRVKFLAKGTHHRIGVEFMHILHATGEKAAGTGCGVVNGTNDAVLSQRIVIFHKHERSCEPYDIARRKVLPGCLVGTFSKAPNQLFEHQAHVVVADFLGAEVHGGYFLHHLKEQVGFV